MRRFKFSTFPQINASHECFNMLMLCKNHVTKIEIFSKTRDRRPKTHKRDSRMSFKSFKIPQGSSHNRKYRQFGSVAQSKLPNLCGICSYFDACLQMNNFFKHSHALAVTLMLPIDPSSFKNESSFSTKCEKQLKQETDKYQELLNIQRCFKFLLFPKYLRVMTVCAFKQLIICFWNDVITIH